MAGEAFLVAGVRTPIGSMGGALAEVPAPELGAVCIKEVLARAGLSADGVWDVYGDKHMGVYGDRCAEKCGLTKKDQDDFAVRSHTRARAAIKDGTFKAEIVPVAITVKKQTVQVAEDEGPSRFDEAKL